MVLFIVYALAVWGLVYALRGRVLRYPVLLLGVAGAALSVHAIAGAALGHDYLAARLMILIGDLYAALVLLVGMVIALFARRRSASDCKGCGYDLAGNTSGICPECAHPIPRHQSLVLSDQQGAVSS